MAGDIRGSDSMSQPPQRPRDDGQGTGADKGWTAVSYLIGGVVAWGLIGWLVDRWLHAGGIATAIGIMLGAAGGVFLIVRRMGSGS
jgi:F0F1-type ATP synthase assembly protein I